MLVVPITDTAASKPVVGAVEIVMSRPLKSEEIFLIDLFANLMAP